MKQQTKAIIAIAILTAMLPLMILPASANSALTEWGGKEANGVVPADKDCPIVVEGEKLTFNIPELPNADSHNIEYTTKSTVTAEYTFYNPSDMTVTAKLAFPYGVLGNIYQDSESNVHNITVNGEKIDAEIRHTLYTNAYFGNYGFDVDTDLPRLLNGYAENETFNNDTPVTKYTVYLYTDNDITAYTWTVDIAADDYPSSYFYIPSASYYQKQDNGDVRVTGIINSGFKKIDIYVLGEAKGVPEFKYYTRSWSFDGEKHGGEEVAGETSISWTEQIDFTSFIFEYYDEAGGISEMDWYNATVHRLEMADTEIPYLHFARFDEDYHDYFMSWYYYEITLDAGERIVNSVTAPMYPKTSIRYKPPVFTYTYLISPASTWAEFGNLDIYINTPYYLTGSNIDGFEKTEGGYELHLDGLPMEKDRYKLSLDGITKIEGGVKDLTFKICSEENPDNPGGIPVWAGVLIIIVLIVLLPIIIVLLVIYGVVYLVRRVFEKKS